MDREISQDSPPTERDLVAMVALRLQTLLPPGWSAEATDPQPRLTVDAQRRLQADGAVRITAPDGRAAAVVIEAKSLINPKDAAMITAQLDMLAPDADGQLVVARYLSPSTRGALAESGLSYMDWTGNVRVTLSNPGLALLAAGANRDPFRTPERPTNSLRGVPAAKVTRALIDRLPPWKMRQLANEARTSLGSTARTVDFLDREALVRRDRGTILEVDWPRLLGRWAEDYDVASRRRVTPVLAPRGLDAVEASLRQSTENYVISGSLAARRLAPYADARLGLIYVSDTERFVGELGVRSTPSRPNVLLIEPRDDLPFARSRTEDGLQFAAPSQIFVDLMSGPGRSVEEAAALLDWMQANEAAWRW